MTICDESRVPEDCERARAVTSNFVPEDCEKANAAKSGRVWKYAKANAANSGRVWKDCKKRMVQKTVEGRRLGETSKGRRMPHGTVCEGTVAKRC